MAELTAPETTDAELDRLRLLLAGRPGDMLRAEREGQLLRHQCCRR